MYALQRVSDAILQVALPLGTSLPMPMARPCNVFLLPGSAPAVVDTGHACAREALLAAMQDAGFAPEGVRRVLLTGASSLHTGNLSLFPNATVVAAPTLRAANAWWKEELESLASLAKRLQERDDAPEAWSAVDVAAGLAPLLPEPLPESLEILSVGEGERAAAGQLSCEALHVPGCDPAGCAWFDTRSRILFVGRALYLRGTPDFRDVPAGTRSVDRLAQLDVACCLPMVGPPEHAWLPAIRGLSLQIHGALANLPYAFAGPTSPVDLALTDLGGLPDDLLHFVHRVRWYAELLGELVEAGVVEREGNDPLAPCVGGSAQGSRTARILERRS